MERKVRKKRSSGAPQRKERRDSVKSGARTRPSESMSRKGASLSGTVSDPSHNVLGMQLNPETARQAIILSEVIGKPVSKRRGKF